MERSPWGTNRLVRATAITPYWETDRLHGATALVEQLSRTSDLWKKASARQSDRLDGATALV